MSAWLLAAMGLLPPLIAAVVACGRGGTSVRLVADQLAYTQYVIELVLLDFAFDQSSSFGLVLALALLGLPAMLVLLLFRERWL
jgi:hypothetical protein